MATTTITQLPSSGALTGAEVVPIVQGLDTVQTTTQDIADLGGGGGIIAVDSGASSTVRIDNNNCASGQYSTVSGGTYNTASGACSTVGGGYCNTASGGYSTVGGGGGNTASCTCSTVGGGSNNTASSLYSSILGGACNNTSTFDKAMIVGSNITADRACATFVNNLSIKSIPTSAAGLPSGAVWNNGGVLNIV